jgi:hypothetical protein
MLIPFNTTFGPGGGSGGGDPPPSGGSGTIPVGTFIPDAVEAARRMEFVANHQLGVPGSERGFHRITPEEEATAMTYVASSASQAQSLIQTHAGTAGVKIISCNWDGISIFTPSGVTGPPAGSLTANASVDFGFNRLGSKILIRPASGRTPIMSTGTTSTEWFWTGVDTFEFRDMEFRGICLRQTRNSFFPTLIMWAANNCLFRDQTNSNYGVFTSNAPFRTLHLENCVFRNVSAVVMGGGQTARFFNVVSIRHRENDFFGDRNYPRPLVNGWIGRTWMSGCACYVGSTDNWGTFVHPDFHQIMSTQPQGPSGQNDLDVRERLIEFNYWNCGRPATQSLWGGDGGIFGDYHTIVHNNVFMIGAYHNRITDGYDRALRYVGNNHFLRQSIGYGNSAETGEQDSTPWLNAVNMGSPLRDPAGYVKLVRNVTQLSLINAFNSRNPTISDNENVDPRLAAHNASAPASYRMKFAGSDGNGGGFVTTQSPRGFVTFNMGETDADTKAQAIAKMRAFLRPRGGQWITNAAQGAGAVDPSLWPARPTDLAA